MSCGFDGAWVTPQPQHVSRPELHNYDKKGRFRQCGNRGGVASWVLDGEGCGNGTASITIELVEALVGGERRNELLKAFIVLESPKRIIGGRIGHLFASDEVPPIMKCSFRLEGRRTLLLNALALLGAFASPHKTLEKCFDRQPLGLGPGAQLGFQFKKDADALASRCLA